MFYLIKWGIYTLVKECNNARKIFKNFNSNLMKMF